MKTTRKKTTCKPIVNVDVSQLSDDLIPDLAVAAALWNCRPLHHDCQYEFLKSL